MQENDGRPALETCIAASSISISISINSTYLLTVRSDILYQ
jgi:hypothetical protein